jgi:PhnB protein
MNKMIGHYLMFNNNCQEALETYQLAFDAKVIQKQTYGQMPPHPDFPVQEEHKELIMNVQFEIGGQLLMASDAAQYSADPGTSSYVTVTAEDKKFITKAWDILKEDGEVFYDLQPSFFAGLHGSLRDKFGINWMFTANLTE